MASLPKLFRKNKGQIWYFCGKDSDGKWRNHSTETADEQEATRVVHSFVAAQLAADDKGPPTLNDYAEPWLKKREDRGLVSAGDDRTRLTLHVLPALGHMKMEDLRPRHFRDLIEDLKGNPKLAPRTVIKVYRLVHVLFRSAVVDEIVPANPVALEPGVLPKNVDKDPEWRATALYTKDEVYKLISDARIPPDRRMVYGLKYFAAFRASEGVENLRWRHVDLDAKPLARINLGKTKAELPRSVPLHPALADMLQVWRDEGYPAYTGSVAGPDDLVVPSARGLGRSASKSQNQLLDDLEMLGLRVKAASKNRRGHDLRRSFITHARADGARPDLLKMVTHGHGAGIIDVYTSLPYESLCAEVGKLSGFTPTHSLVSSLTKGIELSYGNRSSRCHRQVVRQRSANATGPDEKQPETALDSLASKLAEHRFATFEAVRMGVDSLQSLLADLRAVETIPAAVLGKAEQLVSWLDSLSPVKRKQWDEDARTAAAERSSQMWSDPAFRARVLNSKRQRSIALRKRTQTASQEAQGVISSAARKVVP